MWCAMVQDVSVGSLWERQNDRELRSWDVNFVRDFNDWELEEVTSFFNVLYLL